MLLVRCPLVGIARRHRNTDTQRLGEIQECRDVLGRMPIENGGVYVDGETAGLGGPYSRYGAIEHPFLGNRLIMMLLEAVEMDREKQVWRGFELIELLLQQQSIGTQRHELLTRHDPFDDGPN